MKAMELHEIRFVVKCQIMHAVYEAKFNLGKMWTRDMITEQQYNDADRELSNVDALATVAINNAESSEEIEEVVAEVERHLRRYVERAGLPCRF